MHYVLRKFNYRSNISLGISGISIFVIVLLVFVDLDTKKMSAGVSRVDTVEIESEVVRAAEFFRPRVENTFVDPRSTIYIEDAKYFFLYITRNTTLLFPNLLTPG